MDNLYLGWDEYVSMAEKLADAISGKYDSILAINRGGLVIGRILSDLLNLPLSIISAKFYQGKSQCRLIIDDKISGIEPLGKSVLIVDDIVDTGKTISGVKKFLQDRYKIAYPKVASIFVKAAKADYYIRETKEWVIFPYEKNEYR